MYLIITAIAAAVMGLAPDLLWRKRYGGRFIYQELLPLRRRYRLVATFGLMLFMVSVLLISESFGGDTTGMWFFAPLIFMSGNRVLYEPYYTSDVIDKLERFSLYLRPFDLSPSNKSYWAKGRLGIDEALENLIGKELNRKIAKFYCIGDPNAASPSTLGASCIYASDEEWKTTVEVLIKLSKVIVLRVMNTEGCLWEIHRCTRSHLNKTIFLIDNEDNYKILYDLLADYKIDMPDIPVDNRRCTALFLNDKQTQWNSICLNNKKDIKTMVTDYLDSHQELNDELVAEKTIENIIAKPFEPMSVSSVWSHRISIILQPFWYMNYNKWPILWVIMSVVSLVIFLVLGTLYDCLVVAYFLCVLLWALLGPRISMSFNSWGSDYLQEHGNKILCKWVCVYSIMIAVLVLVV